jgi:hypothetical protein
LRFKINLSNTGDDHEGWSRGLTPKLFWESRLQLLSANRPELESLIDRIVSSSLDNASASLKRIEVFEVRATKLFISLPSDLDNNRPPEDELDVTISGGNLIELKCEKYKIEKTVAVSNSRAMKNLSTALSSVLPDCMQMMGESNAVRLTAIGPNLDESKEMMVAIGLCLLGQEENKLC